MHAQTQTQQHTAGGSLRFNGIGKTFPGVKALDNISFVAHPGQVHALMGENGAGKSTLLKILGGAYIPSSGDLQIGEQTMVFKSTADSIGSGVAVIHQELHLVPEMTVAENLFLGHLPASFGLINRGTLRQQALACLKGLADEIDPQEKVGRLSLGQRQLVEIAKALSRGAHVIAFDEPTSSLSAREIDRLMAIIGRLRDEGKVVLYVSHRMEEVFRICNAVTVFKDGRYVRTFEDMSELTHDQLVTCMVGRDIQDIYDYRPRQRGAVALKVDGLLGPGLREPVSFEAHKGEILGLFGLVGAGRTELFRMLSGLERNTAGRLELRGHELKLRSPRDAIAAGILLCPEDRKKEGILPLASVAEHQYQRPRRAFHLRLPVARPVGEGQRRQADQSAESENAQRGAADHVPIRRQSAEGHSRSLAVMPMKVLLLDEPTRGIDIGAKAEIYQIIHDLAASGIAVIVVSSDLMEVMVISDRIRCFAKARCAANCPAHRPRIQPAATGFAAPTR